MSYGPPVINTRTILGAASLVAFVACVWFANWLLSTYGIVPIGFGLMGPAGVYAAGLSFGLRDAVHESLGRRWVFIGILAGAALSLLIEDFAEVPGGHVPIAVASALAFLFAETADLAIYTPLRERGWVGAVVASNIVGAVVDSALFLWLAFGSLDFIEGQIVGKSYMIGLSILLVGVVRAVLRNGVRSAPAG